MVTKRQGRNGLTIMFRPFGQLVMLQVECDKQTARVIEGQILRGCKTGDFSGLEPMAKEACIRMYRNKNWELPPELGAVGMVPNEEMVLWAACEMFIKSPEVTASKAKPRYKMCVVHLVKYFGKERPVKAIWAPDIRAYQAARISQGASPSSVNWEKATLSRVLQNLVDYRLLDANPCRLVKNLSQRIEERQAYLSMKTVSEIADHCPEWYRPILWTGFYTGMRRGELLGLTRRDVNLSKRMIVLKPTDTKESHWKRVPLHVDLIPMLAACLDGPVSITGRVFQLRTKDGVKPLGLETVRNCWPRAIEVLGFKDPVPRFHDLRHTWKTNARRSGMHPEIQESILGHATRQRSVSERYGRISDEELLAAIDSMTFDHGDTEILIAKELPEKNVSQKLAKGGTPKKKATGSGG